MSLAGAAAAAQVQFGYGPPVQPAAVQFGSFAEAAALPVSGVVGLMFDTEE